MAGRLIKPGQEFNMPHTTDAEHLQFIFNRLKHVYGENPNYDYMLRFQEIIAKLSPSTKPNTPKLEHPDLRGHLSDAIRDALNTFMRKVISFELSDKMAAAIIEQVEGFSQQWQESQDQKQQSVDAGTTEIVERRPYIHEVIKLLENTINATVKNNDLVFPMKQGKHILAYLQHMDAEGYIERLEKAARWDALFNAPRFHMMGSAGFDPKTGKRQEWSNQKDCFVDAPESVIHFGIEFWSFHGDSMEEQLRTDAKLKAIHDRDMAWGQMALTLLTDDIIARRRKAALIEMHELDEQLGLDDGPTV